MTTSSTPPRKQIDYDRQTLDYKMTLDGQLVGWARTFQEAEKTLDDLAYEQALHTQVTTTDIEAEQAGIQAECPPCGEPVRVEMIEGTQHYTCPSCGWSIEYTPESPSLGATSDLVAACAAAYELLSEQFDGEEEPAPEVAAVYDKLFSALVGTGWEPSASSRI